MKKLIHKKHIYVGFTIIILAVSLTLAVYAGKNEISLPQRTADESITGGELTTWSCVYFGEYPQTEIVSGEFNAVDSYALAEGDYISDPGLYAVLCGATWDTDNTALVDGNRYIRVCCKDLGSGSGTSLQHYIWDDAETYHYFRFDPIRWRVLEETDGRSLLFSVKALDAVPYNESHSDTYWSDSYIRTWLNGEFYDMAFSDSDKNRIMLTDLNNEKNFYFGTCCGEDSRDKVFLLSETETFSTDQAIVHGFCKCDSGGDTARSIPSSTYAKCKGAWWSSLDATAGNCFWFLRTNGYTASNVVYVGDNGDTFNRGISVMCNDAGIVPAIWIEE